MKLSTSAAFKVALLIASMTELSHATLPHELAISQASPSIPAHTSSAAEDSIGRRVHQSYANIARNADSSELMRRHYGHQDHARHVNANPDSYSSVQDQSASDSEMSTDVVLEGRSRYTYYDVVPSSNTSDSTNCTELGRCSRYKYYDVLHPCNGTEATPCKSSNIAGINGAERENTVSETTISLTSAAVCRVTMLGDGALLGLITGIVGMLLV